MAKKKDDKILKVLLITGLSGAGKSSALKILEDIDYEAIDNLPVSLLPNVVEMALKSDPNHENPALAIGIDVRTRHFQPDKILDIMQELRARPGIDVRIVYFDSGNVTLAQRFTETRRKHPLAKDRPVHDGIVRERQMMEVIRGEADYIFDTSEIEIPELRTLLSRRFERDAVGGLSISVNSFGYPRGLPRDADLVFDVRFLRNPHYDVKLRPQDGRDQPVADYVEGDPVFDAFWERLIALILTLLPEYKREGKSYFTIAIGCTGGRHRSVFVAEKLAAVLEKEQYKVNLHHREL